MLQYHITPIIAVHRQGATPTGATYCTVDSAYFVDNTIVSKTDVWVQEYHCLNLLHREQ